MRHFPKGGSRPVSRSTKRKTKTKKLREKAEVSAFRKLFKIGSNFVLANKSLAANSLVRNKKPRSGYDKGPLIDGLLFVYKLLELPSKAANSSVNGLSIHSFPSTRLIIIQSRRIRKRDDDDTIRVH